MSKFKSIYWIVLGFIISATIIICGGCLIFKYIMGNIG